MDFLSELEKCGANSLSIAVVRNHQITEAITEGHGVTTHTRFQAASISKMVFTLAFLRLVSEGRISLEDDVNNYLGDCPITDREGNTVSLNARQILSHTAGLGVDGFYGYPMGTVLPTTSQIINGEPPCNSPKVYCEYAPDEHWVYSGADLWYFKNVSKILRKWILPILCSSMYCLPLIWRTAPFGRI